MDVSARAKCNNTHSESELHLVAQLVLWSRIPTLTAREVAQRKLVSKEFSTWEAENVWPIVKARRLNRTHDWFFPVFAKTPSWSWKGIPHGAASNLASTKHQTLPPLERIPFIYPRHDIIACSGGLLLIKLQSTNPSTDWHPLFVCNPFTKQCRELPEADCGAPWDYSGVQVQLEVDEEANSYTAILLFVDSVCFYESKSNTWTCNTFTTNAGTWGNTQSTLSPWGFVSPSVCEGKRVYIADIELSGPIATMADPLHAQVNVDAGHLRIHEINYEAGTWERIEFRLMKSYQNFGEQAPFCDQFRENLGWKSSEFDTGILRYLNLVECGEDLYAIIPARLDEQLHDDECCSQNGNPRCKCKETPLKLESEGVEWMPLQFHVFQVMRGERAIIGSHAVIRIGVPVSRGDLASRRNALFEQTLQSYQPFRNWFSCTAVGSVLWVSVQDYLVEYDVATGNSRTHIIHEKSGWGNDDEYPIWGDDNLGFAYRLSFHMKP